MPTNEERRERAMAALEFFAEHSGQDMEVEQDDVVGYCGEEVFSLRLATATMHYEAER